MPRGDRCRACEGRRAGLAGVTPASGFRFTYETRARGPDPGRKSHGSYVKPTPVTPGADEVRGGRGFCDQATGVGPDCRPAWPAARCWPTPGFVAACAAGAAGVASGMRCRYWWRVRPAIPATGAGCWTSGTGNAGAGSGGRRRGGGGAGAGRRRRRSRGATALAIDGANCGLWAKCKLCRICHRVVAVPCRATGR